MANMDLLLTPPISLLASLARLRQLTGFVTALCREGDSRPLAFARYFHVRRVVWMSHAITRLHSAKADDLDLNLINWYAWAHDLNRWPFAHNSEKGLYDQAEDLSRFLSERGIIATNSQVVDLQRIIAKNTDGLSTEGRIVLLADIVAGFIEDPLWCIVGLNLNPKIVPQSVRAVLGLPLDDHSFLLRLLRLNEFFYVERQVEPFVTRFDEIFEQIAINYITRSGIAKDLPLNHPEFESNRTLIKESFMRKVLFPYNNEKISHGSRLKQALVEPLVQTLGNDAFRILTTIDDPQAIRLAIERGVITEKDATCFYPSIDYINEFEPELCFRSVGPKLVASSSGGAV